PPASNAKEKPLEPAPGMPAPSATHSPTRNSNDFQSEEDTAWPAWADGAALTSMASARMCFIAIPSPWCDSAAKSIARSILAEVCLEAVDRAQQSEVVGAVLSGARSWLGGHWVVACFQLFKRARSGPPDARSSPSIAVSGTRTTAGPSMMPALGCSLLP